ncbi:MAG TPA: hypothetical protein VGN26_06625 [Armatimonadota bacterium]|jgi:hypothetical protein
MNQREKLMVGACGLVVLVVGLPTLVTATVGMRGGKDALKQADAKALAAKRQVRSLEAEIATLKPQVGAVTWSETPDLLYPDVATQIFRLGKKAGVSIPSIRHVDPRPLDVLSEQPLVINVSATFPAFVKFLYMMQDPALKLSMDRVRITSTDTESDAVRVELSVSTYTTFMLPSTSKGRPSGSAGGSSTGSASATTGA